jgi:hypothetical protein
MKRWRIVMVLGLAAVLSLPGTQAEASVPGLSSTTPAAGATGQSRYGVSVTFTYDGSVTGFAAATLTRTGTGTVVPITPAVNGDTVTLTADASLVAGTAYTASVQLDVDTPPATVTFTTLGAPAHPLLRVKVITALAGEATQDIVRRLDRANLLAVPRPQDVVDISLASGRVLAAVDLVGYHAALVVTDRDVNGQDAAASVLASFCAHGHGVVVAGQTHWKQGPLWSAASSISTTYSSAWALQWSPYGVTNPIAYEGARWRGR